MTDPVRAGGGRQLLLATRNRKKLAELRRVLAPLLPDVDVLGLDDVAPYAEPTESAPDFGGNAMIKAQAGMVASGLPTIGEDSGLCVRALGGMPGVLSARWAGRVLPGDTRPVDRRNLELLLDQLRDLPDRHRGASFACVAVYLPVAVPGSAEEIRGRIVARGRLAGSIARHPAGDGGFGYDPIFVPRGDTRTAAQLTADEKDAISHRGRALRELAGKLVAVLGDQ